MPKFWTTVTPVVFEIFSKKKFWGRFWTYLSYPIGRNLKYIKKAILEFQVALESRWNLSSSWISSGTAFELKEVLFLLKIDFLTVLEIGITVPLDFKVHYHQKATTRAKKVNFLLQFSFQAAADSFIFNFLLKITDGGTIYSEPSMINGSFRP